LKLFSITEEVGGPIKIIGVEPTIVGKLLKNIEIE